VMEAELRELMQAVVGDSPYRITAEAVRHQVVKRRIREAVGVLAAVILAVVGVTAAVRVVGAVPVPAAHHRPAASIAYVAYPGKYSSAEMLVPISTATNTPGKPIRVGTLTGAAFTPDGKTAYVEGHAGTVIPISTATNWLGKPIPVPMPGYRPFDITMNPDGKTAYLTFSWSIGSSLSGSILPISTATNTAGKPIRVAGKNGGRRAPFAADLKHMIAGSDHGRDHLPVLPHAPRRDDARRGPELHLVRHLLVSSEPGRDRPGSRKSARQP
jgi:hypothetical protein